MKTKVKAAKPVNRRRSDGLSRLRQRAFNIIMIPYAVFLIVTKVMPMLWALFMSFTNYTGFNIGKLKFVGLSNYARVLTDQGALPSILRTAGIAIIVVPLSLLICLFLSLLLNERFRGVGVFRTIWYLPSIIPSIAVVMMWRGMFLKNGGFFNFIRSAAGLQIIDWLDYSHVKASLMIMMLWGAGGGVLNNLAALKCIPQELYEAAELDGASYFTRTFKITIPMISNMIYMNLVTGIIGLLQLFAEPVLLSGEGGLTSTPIEPIYTYMVHIYQQIFVNMRFSYGLAMVYIIFVIIMILTIFMQCTSNKWVYSEVDK